MSIWTPPVSPDAALYAPPSGVSTVSYETTLPASYVLENQGVQVQSETATPDLTGVIQSTNAGDYTQRTVTVSTPTETREVVITEVDVGGGAALQIVVSGTDEIVQTAATTQVETSTVVSMQDGDSGAVSQTGSPAVAESVTAEAVPEEGVAEFTEQEIAQFVAPAVEEEIYDPTTELTPEEIAAFEAEFGFIPDEATGGSSGGFF